MKMNAVSYMIKYLPCLLVNVQVAIYRNLLWQNVVYFEHADPTTIYIIKIFHLHLRQLLSSPENPLNCNNHTVVKSIKRIMNVYSYQVNQCLLPNILNR